MGIDQAEQVPRPKRTSAPSGELDGQGQPIQTGEEKVDLGTQDVEVDAGSRGAGTGHEEIARRLLRERTELDQLRAEAQKRFANLTWKQIVEDGMVIAGSPETVREQAEHMIKSLRIGTVFCLFHMGNMPDWKTRRSTRLFAEKVMPALRDLWPEWKNDDRFWCRPWEDRVRPEAPVPGGEQ